MTRNEIQSQLTNRALMFHRVLLDENVYLAPLDEKEFLNRVNKEISQRAKSVDEHGEDLELALLVFPVDMIMNLSDVLPCANWDYEFGYKSFFKDLGKLFSLSNWKVAWEYDPATSTLHFALNDKKWSIENVRHIAEVESSIYSQIIEKLNAVLTTDEKVLYEAVTGDQTGMLVLVPIRARENLRDYLISTDDPRAMSFYE